MTCLIVCVVKKKSSLLLNDVDFTARSDEESEASASREDARRNLYPSQISWHSLRKTVRKLSVSCEELF